MLSEQDLAAIQERADSAKCAFSEVRKNDVLWEICDIDIPALLSHIEEQDKRILALAQNNGTIMAALKNQISAYNGTVCKICARHNSQGCNECDFELKGLVDDGPVADGEG